jgi:uncharacterized protein YbjT (DUF2867 family)
MEQDRAIKSVLVTGATGFVGRQVVRELLARGLRPVCIVRSPDRLHRQHRQVDPDRLTAIAGSLSDTSALRQAADLSQAAIHLVGIIIERRLQGQTFRKVHVAGTRHVVDAIEQAGIKRYVHMSALGTRPNAVTPYHRTKWDAEEYVRQSGLAWTIFRPSLIHGASGEFMQLMRRFMCGLMPPVIPYFGSGEAKLQPVSVKDVAYCFVEALQRDETAGQVYSLGGPKAYSWVELYNACRALIPGAKRYKPMVSQPVPVAKLLAVLSAPPMALAELVVPSIGMMRFDRGQVQMSQEDSVCDHTIAEKAFDMKMRAFEVELRAYADLIP